MKKAILFFAMLFFTQMAFGQIKAVTENGDSAILYENGTWEYPLLINAPLIDPMFGLTFDTDTVEEFNIPLNPEFFRKSSDATFLLKSRKGNFGVWLNQQDWSCKKQKGEHDYQCINIRRGIYAMLISEKTYIPVEWLVEAALINAKKVATDLKIITQEYRYVNGVEVLMMQMSGIIEGVKMTFLGYYYSNKNGSVQVVTYSVDNIAKKHRKEMEKFLNGFVEVYQK